MDVRHKLVSKSVARFQIKRFKYKNYMRMFNGWALINVVNRRIGFKLHQMRFTLFIWICMTAHLTVFLVYTIETKEE